MLIKHAVVAAIGALAIAVLLFDVLLNVTSMFNHASVGLPASIEWYMRWLLVTPDMHRVHRSIVRAGTDSNFGFNFPWWDRLFGTCRGLPRDGYEAIGIAFRDAAERRLTPC
jgi:sterol desaturase/sphingolipid hydroxylase (fatty acid hydroxylase superfamily)